jgi:hypothetical protein
LPTLASKSTLLEESRIFLDAYARLGDPTAACQMLLDGLLLQHSRETRITIVAVLRKRLVSWNPPLWVLSDLVSFMREQPEMLRYALLLHIVRQDQLLYDFVQQVLVTRWQHDEHAIIRSDVQGFLDGAQITHPEVARWSHSTRERLSNAVLTTLRDCGLLSGKFQKQIVLPTVPVPVVSHLIHLLQAEGIHPTHVAKHADWHLWLKDAAQAQNDIQVALSQEQMV